MTEKLYSYIPIKDLCQTKIKRVIRHSYSSSGFTKFKNKIQKKVYMPQDLVLAIKLEQFWSELDS